MSFTGPPSRFSCSNCHSGTAMQIRGTVAGIYGIRRLQVKRCGRLGLGPSSRLTVAVVFQGPEQFRAKSVRGPLRRSRTYGSFRAKVHEDHL